MSDPQIDIATELTRLRELRDAVRVIQPWPRYRYEGGEPKQCVHCLALLAWNGDEYTVTHAETCAGVRIATLLAALDGGESGRD